MSKWLICVLLLIVSTVGIFATAYAQGGDAARGKALFAQDCAVCHGDRAQGRVGATLAKDFPGIRVDSLLKEIISNGVQGSVMPAWSNAKGGPLSDTDINDLVAFIRSLGNLAPTAPAAPSATKAGPAPTPVATFPPGDTTRGAQVYTENCAMCHGANGEGRVGATLSKDWAGINVVTLLDTTISRGVAGSKMPAWSQSYGGPLTNQQISDVAAYVLTLKKSSQPLPASTPTTTENQPFGGLLALLCVGVIGLIAVAILAFGLASTRARTS